MSVSSCYVDNSLMNIFKFVLVTFVSVFFSVLIEFCFFQKSFCFLTSKNVCFNDYSIVFSELESNNIFFDGNNTVSLKDPFFIFKNDSFSYFRGVFFEFDNIDTRHLPIKIYCSDENGNFTSDFIQGRVSSRKNKEYVPVGQYSKDIKIVIGKDYSQYVLNAITVNPNLNIVIKNFNQTRITRLTLVCLVLFIIVMFRKRLRAFFIVAEPYLKKIENFTVCNFSLTLLATQFLLFFYFITSFSTYYSLVSLDFPDSIYKIFSNLLIVLVLYKISLMFIDKNILFVAISIISILFLCFVYHYSNCEKYIYEFVLLAICCYKLSYKRIFIMYLFAVGLIISSEIILTLCGELKDIAYLKDAGEYRHSFGSIYPTDFACSILFVCLALWAVLKKTHCFMCVAVLLALIYFQLLYTKTRNTELVMCLCIFFVILYSVFIHKINSICKLRIIIIPYKYLILLLAILSVTLGYLYDRSNSFMVSLDHLFSTRLSLVHSAFNNFGISFWGQHIIFVGNGGSVVGKDGYNFIDSSYCLLLIRYGIGCFLIFALMYAFIQKRSLDECNLKVSLVFLIIAIHSFTEHHYIEYFYNPCLLLLFADLKNAPAYN